VTVPALPSLWSGHDVVNHHYRRYVRKTLLACFDSPGWQVERVSYFSSLLLPWFGPLESSRISVAAFQKKRPVMISTTDREL